MPIIPRFLERLLFHRNLVPGPMLDFLGAEAFRAFAAARRLRIFDALANGPRAVTEVARELDTDVRGTSQLLGALEAVGYVRERSGRFEQTPMTARWLPVLGDGIPFFEMMLDRFRDLEDTVRRGEPPLDPRDWLDRRPNGWRDFQAGMSALARMSAGEIARKVRIPSSARRMLDVGGGHGLYSVELCRRHAKLSAIVFDLPQALPSAVDVVASSGMRERVALRAGDFWDDDLGDRHDVALVFNILHANLAAKNLELLRKVASALVPGGLVAILEQVTDGVRGEAAAAAAALNGLALFELAGGQTYAFDEIAGWLRVAGFERPHRSRLRTLPGSVVIQATKRNAPA